MSNKKKIAVISDNPTGPYLANLLEKQGHEAILISSSAGPELDGPVLHQQNVIGRIPFFPAEDTVLKTLTQLQNYYTEQLISEEHESQPKLIAGNETKSFLGFGEAKQQSVEMLSRYVSRESKVFYVNEVILNDFYNSAANFSGKKHFNAEVSELKFTDSKLDRVVLGGHQEVAADYFIFLISPRDYVDLIPTELISGKTRSRIAKTHVWTRVALAFTSENSFVHDNEFMFFIPDRLDVEPCVGFAHPSAEVGRSNSCVWETYLEHGHSEDPELLSSTLKHLRKCAKKALPELDDRFRETIIINPNDGAEFAWIQDNKDLRQVCENGIFSSSYAYPYLGAAQGLVASCQLLSKLEATILADHVGLDRPSSLLDSAKEIDQL